MDENKRVRLLIEAEVPGATEQTIDRDALIAFMRDIARSMGAVASEMSVTIEKIMEKPACPLPADEGVITLGGSLVYHRISHSPGDPRTVCGIRLNPKAQRLPLERYKVHMHKAAQVHGAGLTLCERCALVEDEAAKPE